MTYNFLDAVFLLIVLTFAVTVCMHGFLEELFGKIAIVAGAFVAFMFCGKISPEIEKFIANPPVCIVLAFLLLFITTFLFVKILQKIVEGVLQGEIMGSLDRVLGFILGAIEGLAIVCAVIIVLKAQPWIETDSFMSKSFFVSTLEPMLGSSIESLKVKLVKA